MSSKREIDKIRDSGGQFEIGSIEDGAIIEMVNIGDKKLIIIKEKSIYEYFTADLIDPGRTNINLPNQIQKLIINKGPGSKIVAKTFLTAKNLFKKEFFGDSINIEKLLLLSLEYLREISVLDKEIGQYLSRESALVEEYNDNLKENRSFRLPSITEVESICKTIFQKADHLEQILMEIITQFYSDSGLTKQSHFPKFLLVLEEKYDKKDPFVQFVSEILWFMKLVRNLRNALDHRLNNVTVKDFELQPDSEVLPPTIELNHKETQLQKEAISSVLPIVLENCIYVFEYTIAHLSNKNLKPSILAQSVKAIPPEDRKYEYVQFSFWSPIGTKGYFNH